MYLIDGFSHLNALGVAAKGREKRRGGNVEVERQRGGDRKEERRGREREKRKGEVEKREEER